MKLAALIAVQRVFHETAHAACWGLESVLGHPVETLAKWDGERLQEIGEFAGRIAAVSGLDKPIARELEAVQEKISAAVKFAEEKKKRQAKENRDQKKADDFAAPLFGGLETGAHVDFGDPG